MPRGKRKVQAGTSSPVMAAAEALLALDAAGVNLAMEIYKKLRAGAVGATQTAVEKAAAATVPVVNRKPGPKPTARWAKPAKLAREMAKDAPAKEAHPSTGLGDILGKGVRTAKPGSE